MKKTLRSAAGFTLIEVMVVIVILGILAALVGPRVMGRVDDAKVNSCKVQMKNLESALKQYKLDTGSYPSTEQGLNALVAKPTTGKIPNNYKAEGYLENKTVPKDPWGADYAYISPGEHGDYDLYSFGADGARGGDGNNADIESWNLH